MLSTYAYMIYFLNGLFIGVAIAAPVGPIGLVCIRQTIKGGMRLGFASGLGAACADTFYGIVAAFGISTLSPTLLPYENTLDIVGGIFLIFIGVSNLLSKIPDKSIHLPKKMAGGAFTSTFFLTLTNPMTTFAFAAIFSAFGIIEGEQSILSSFFLVLGVFLGSTAWWFALSSLISWMRHKVSNKVLLWINRISGAVFIILGYAFIFHYSTSSLSK